MVDVRRCPCGRVFVGNHNCPSCNAPFLCSRLLLRVKKRTLARTIAESIRAHGCDPTVIRYYQERYDPVRLRPRMSAG